MTALRMFPDVYLLLLARAVIGVLSLIGMLWTVEVVAVVAENLVTWLVSCTLHRLRRVETDPLLGLRLGAVLYVS